MIRALFAAWAWKETMKLLAKVLNNKDQRDEFMVLKF
jgi:hypothetical protein